MEGRTVGEYKIRNGIGAGAFAAVYLGIHKRTGETVAIKVVKKDGFEDETGLERFHREVELVKSSDHPFIAEFYDVIEDDANLFLIMEFVENGNMLEYVNRVGGLREDQARHYFCQLISVLEYLHSRNVAHRDLKAENVLLDTYYNIRLIDFGLSNLYSAENPYLSTACGSPAYASPEMITGHPYTAASDLWSAAILLYAIVCGELPFEDENMQRLLQKIIYTEPCYPPSVSPQLHDLLVRMLQKDPAERITLAKIKEHPWFSQYQYAQMMDMNFGVSMDWRVVGAGSGSIDHDIIVAMKNLGYDAVKVISDMTSGQTNSGTALYRLLRKGKITELMREVSLESLTAASCTGRRLTKKRGATSTAGDVHALPTLEQRVRAPRPSPIHTQGVQTTHAGQQQVPASPPGVSPIVVSDRVTVIRPNGPGGVVQRRVLLGTNAQPLTAHRESVLSRQPPAGIVMRRRRTIHIA